MPKTASTATWRTGGRTRRRLYSRASPGDVRTITYRQLHMEVCRIANALTGLGLVKGDRVAIYMPMVPEAAIAMLACARLGVIHTVIFGGFSSEAIKDRVNDCQAKVIITADGGWRRGKIVELKANVDRALAGHAERRARRRPQAHGPGGADGRGPRPLVARARRGQADATTRPKAFDSEHPLYILYTSGSTGKPKGVLHTSAGYLLGVDDHDEVRLRPEGRRRLLLHGRRRLGHRPQLRRLRPARRAARRSSCTRARPNHPEPDRFWEHDRPAPGARSSTRRRRRSAPSCAGATTT